MPLALLLLPQSAQQAYCLHCAADVHIGSEIAWGMMTQGIEPRPAFQTYLARLVERPVYKRFNGQSNQWMEELKATG